jgi:parallel beta-helix repeat protein
MNALNDKMLKMKKETLVISIILSLSLVSISGCVEEISIVEEPNIVENLKMVYVDDDGGANFTKIQDAIDHVADGGTIFVRNGSYHEMLTIDKSINLIGESKDNTIIYYNKIEEKISLDSVVIIDADNCKINGFNITSVNYTLDKSPWGILIKSSNNTITNNKIMNVNRGVHLKRGSINNTISWNNISHTKKGISTADSENTIANNKIMYVDQGVYLDRDSINNTISWNNISHALKGIFTEGSNSNNISKNNISSCETYGIYFSGSDNNIISGNMISDNSYGIRLLGLNSKNNKLFGNTIMNNTRGILCCCRANNNVIYYNNFKQNSEYSAKDEVTNHTNQWDNGNLGNYWDDYMEKHPDAIQIDGIWDTPYNIPDEDNIDRFPLVSPVDI